MITGEADVLRDEGEAYAARLREAGVPVTGVRYGGIIHDFVMLNPLHDTHAALAAIAQSTSVLRAAAPRPDGHREGPPAVRGIAPQRSWSSKGKEPEMRSRSIRCHRGHRRRSGWPGRRGVVATTTQPGTSADATSAGLSSTGVYRGPVATASGGGGGAVMYPALVDVHLDRAYAAMAAAESAARRRPTRAGRCQFPDRAAAGAGGLDDDAVRDSDDATPAAAGR